MTARRPLAVAAPLIGVAAVAPNTTHALMWGLLPGAVLLAVGLLQRPPLATSGASRRAGTAMAATLAALAAVTVVGAAVSGTTRLEPGWLDWVTVAAAWATVATITWLGAVIASRPGHRGTGALLVAAVPLGLAFDRAIDAAVPVGFFVHGVTISLGVLAVAVFRLATAGPSGSSAADRPVEVNASGGGDDGLGPT